MENTVHVLFQAQWRQNAQIYDKAFRQYGDQNRQTWQSTWDDWMAFFRNRRLNSRRVSHLIQPCYC